MPKGQPETAADIYKGFRDLLRKALVARLACLIQGKKNSKVVPYFAWLAWPLRLTAAIKTFL